MHIFVPEMFRKHPPLMAHYPALLTPSPRVKLLTMPADRPSEDWPVVIQEPRGKRGI